MGAARVVRAVVAIVAVFALSPSQAAAQGAGEGVTGTWDVRWAQAIRSWPDGRFEVQGWGEAELVIERDGERLVGTWTTEVRERVVWTVEGVETEKGLRLTSVGHDSDNAELAIVESITWEAELEPDGLEGTVAMRIRGRDREPALRPFTATRSGGG